MVFTSKPPHIPTSLPYRNHHQTRSIIMSSLKRWDSLPREIRLLILETLVQDGCRLSRLVTVSREWQTDLERYNFARITLTPARLVDFGFMVHRNRALVRYIWFCLELDDYDCTICAPDSRDEEAFDITDTDKCPITPSFQNLFSTLSTWEPRGDLVLDISIYSPSDSEHWFKYLTFVTDTPSAEMPVGDGRDQAISAKVYHDPQHGWDAGFRHSAPPRSAIHKIFHVIMDMGPFDSDELEFQWWDQLPSVPVVTSLLLRQQNRRRWKPRSLAHMFARFPRLQEVHYEPWREWDSMMKNFTDKHFGYFFTSIQGFNNHIKRLTVFENFNQQYPASLKLFQAGVDLSDCENIRNPAPAVSRMAALASLKLEHLAASFLVDARHFFEIEPSWVWPNLTSLVLTSKVLVPDGDQTEIEAVLQAAAAAAMKMPRLETMEIWNGRKGLTALFRYQALRDIRKAVIMWRSTWKLAMGPSTIQAWEVVMHQYGGWRLDLVQEQLDEALIKSHGDAIQHLMLPSQVIRPISLRQIQMEQKVLEGVETV
ncbi:uncharacterized protein B0H64DRAFT_85584 [Chaetomium fimeti]|uniref:DUF6546 domain-containing protein n=1 Tax=Chaetomium fimeti TaxID=1854472 RepID=A0AAE0HLU4_9PEZI|nr:hypothetical protein B0H64DRAFT_85584 [Chaetomium fimeti]